MGNKFLGVVLCVAVALAMVLAPAVATVPAVSAAGGNTVSLKISPATQAVLPGANFNLTVRVDITAGEPVAAAECHIDFDSTYFNVTSISTGAFSTTLKNVYNNTAVPATVDFSAGRGLGEPSQTANFTLCTIECTAGTAEGVTAANFVYVAPSRKTQVMDPSAVDYLSNWTAQVTNGTIIVGTPKFTVNVTPQYPYPYPPYNIAMGGIGIGYNITWDMGVPVSWDFLAIAPTDPLPNTTSWNWGEIIIPTAVDFVPGWAFVNWTPVLGTLLPDDTIEYPEGSGNYYTIHPMVVVNDALSKSTTANFAPLPPEIGVAPTSLSFETFEGTNPADQLLTVTNTGGGTLNWSASDDAGWLSEDPTSGSLTTSVTVGSEDVTVSVNVTGLSAGDYTGNITISGSPSVVVPVSLKVKPATAVDNFRDIIPSTNSGKPGETNELYAGETFDVYVNFTAPPTSPANGFNAIGLTDVAPNGWTVTVDKNWTWINGTPATALKVNAVGNKAEIMLSGPYATGTTISLMYKVTVPTTATPGLNNWSCCAYPSAGAGPAWLEYYFNGEGPYTNCVSGDWQVTVTQPGDIVGVTREVNTALLSDVDVQMYLVGPTYLRNDISSPQYDNKAWVTGTYFLLASKTRWYDLDISDSVMLPGKAFTIDLTTPALLAAGKTFNFEGDYGLIPRAPAMSYALRSVNLWKFPPNAAWGLSEWKAMDVCSAWLNPS